MLATLYLPEQPVQEVFPPATDNLLSWVPELLGCIPELVDVLATGNGYTVYSIFDYEGAVNLHAMQAVGNISGIPFNPDDEDMTLQGPILIVRT